MSLRLVKSRLGRGSKWIYVPDALPRIIEEPSNIISEDSESESESESNSGYAISECGFFEDDSNELVPTVLDKKLDYDIYSALLNITTMLRQSGCAEFKRYQSVFGRYLQNYSTYLNNRSAFLEDINAIYSTRTNEAGGCCYFFKKKPAVNTVTNKLILLIIHSKLELDLASIQRINELARASEMLIHILPSAAEPAP